MKISELIKRTGVPRETIHYYAREGLLPAPEKTSRNQADYSELHVERLNTIRELREHFFLPVSSIREIFEEQRMNPAKASALQIKAEYYQPLDQFLPEEIRGEKKFLKATGMSADRLANFESYGIINPTVRRDAKVYSQEDIKIGKIIGRMRAVGLSHERGFSREGLSLIRDELQKIIEIFDKEYWDTAERIMTREEAIEMAAPAVESVGVFIFHLYQRLAREALARRLAEMPSTPTTGA